MLYSIREIQTELKKQGYDPGPIDNKDGKKTQAAVKEFQKANKGLTVDGVAGPKTCAVLFKDTKIADKSGFKLDARSERSLKGVHPDLVKVIRLAAKNSAREFTITEGLRTVARQRQLVAAGASKTMNSRHITGHAVDIAFIVAGKVDWSTHLFKEAYATISTAAKELNVPVEWGGSWRSFVDMPHFQLPFKQYPK